MKCPKYSKLHQEFLRSETVRRLNEENREFVEHLAAHSGLKGATTVKEILELQDIIFTEVNYFLSNYLLCNYNFPENV